MKILGFFTSVIIGIICAWIISDNLYINFFINIGVPLLVSGFVTSILIAKDALPPNYVLEKSYLLKKDDSMIQRRIGSGIFASCVFIFLKTTSVFLSDPFAFGNSIIFIIGSYIFAVLIFLIWGLLLGGLCGRIGVSVRDLFENKLVHKKGTSL